MNLTKCKNGHIYDTDKFLSCPHCVSLSDRGMPDTSSSRKDTDWISSTHSASYIIPEETTGWLVCIKGVEKGMSFPLYAGKNLIGRAANMMSVSNTKILFPEKPVLPSSMTGIPISSPCARRTKSEMKLMNTSLF